MNLSIAKAPSVRWITESARLLLQRPPRRQIAALCHRQGENGPEVLLITSRKSRRWILPKGWPMADRTARKTASMEAFEEAGIIGKAGKKPIGEFASRKGLANGYNVRTSLTVYPLRMEKQTDSFPEKGKRDLVWLSVEDAAERCNEQGLRDLLRSDKVRDLLKVA